MAKAQLGFTTRNGMSGDIRSIGAGHPQAALEAATRCCVNTPALTGVLPKYEIRISKSETNQKY